MRDGMRSEGRGVMGEGGRENHGDELCSVILQRRQLQTTLTSKF